MPGLRISIEVEIKSTFHSSCSVLHCLLCEDSVLEYLTAAATTTIQAPSAVNRIILAGSVQLPIHSLKEQKVAPVRELIVLVSIRIVHAVTHI